MKNSKRDITLNEKDSVEDMLLFERALLRDYCAALFTAERKETRTFFVGAISDVAEDVFFLQDLLSTVESRNPQPGKSF